MATIYTEGQIELAALQDKYSAIENEEFRRQFQLNLDEYKSAATDDERQEVMDFLLDEVFNKIGKSKEDSFKLVYAMDQIESEGLLKTL